MPQKKLVTTVTFDNLRLVNRFIADSQVKYAIILQNK